MWETIIGILLSIWQSIKSLTGHNAEVKRNEKLKVLEICSLADELHQNAGESERRKIKTEIIKRVYDIRSKQTRQEILNLVDRNKKDYGEETALIRKIEAYEKIISQK